MKSLYKVYDPDNKAMFFNSLREIRKIFDLDDDDIKKIFAKQCYTTKDGLTIINYNN